tara:strand:+ start:5265 stop:5630 length:366 start_codon:yes stop_codon:yes gene_type:complete
MKINKFNENVNSWLDNATFRINPSQFELTDQDFKQIYRSGRKVYIVNKQLEMIEVTKAGDMRWKYGNQISDLFPYALFITEEYAVEMKEMVDNIKQVKILADKKMTTLFEMVRALSQENGM